jgi:hypothetical protein
VSILAAKPACCQSMIKVQPAIRGKLGAWAAYIQHSIIQTMPCQDFQLQPQGCQPPRCICYRLGTIIYQATWKPETAQGDINLEPTAA